MGLAGRAGVGLMLVLGTIGVAALVPGVGLAADGEGSITVKVGDEAPVEFEFGFSPKKLPPADLGSGVVKIGLEESRFFWDGIPPGISRATIGLDSSIELEPGDLPVCRWPAIEGGIQSDGGRFECRGAVVGRAEAQVLFAYPESKPIEVPAGGKIYNGRTHSGTTDLMVELQGAVPMSGPLDFIVPVRKVRQGRIGGEVTIAIPRLGEGYGLMTDLNLELGRAYSERGEEEGYVTAKCPDGKLVASLSGVLTDGTESQAESIRACSRRTPVRSTSSATAPSVRALRLRRASGPGKARRAGRSPGLTGWAARETMGDVPRSLRLGG